MIVIKIHVLLWCSVSCVDGDWICRYEQAAIEGE